MTHLYLIRHADYLYDVIDEKYPKRNLGLTAEGIVQAEKLRNRLVNTGEIKPNVFISSTERGAKETAEIIAPAFDVDILFDEDVEEWRSEDGTLSTEEFMGTWNALSDTEKPYYRWVEGCETILEFSLRVNVTLNRILSAYEGKSILIMTHGVFIQASFAYFFGFSLAIPQQAVPEVNKTSITHWFERHANKWVLERVNDHHHLD
ncbi:MAG: histidine phosphatase family protein [Chloroflexota bacterium]